MIPNEDGTIIPNEHPLTQQYLATRKDKPLPESEPYQFYYSDLNSNLTPTQEAMQNEMNILLLNNTLQLVKINLFLSLNHINFIIAT